MRFNSYEFLIFFAGVLCLQPFFSAGRPRHMFLLAASYFFYATWNPPFVLLLIFTTLLDYYCGSRIYGSTSAKARRAWFALSLVLNLGILGYFKYGNFFLDNIAFVSHIDPEPFYLDVVIPLGISFYTFQSMSYTIDVYRRAIEPCKDLLDFSLYVTFFPQLIAGPILRTTDFLPQLLRRDPVRVDEIFRGVELFLIGLFKKVVVADNFAIISDRVFSAPNSYDAISTWMGIVAFQIQIYCDFSGYSDMARGMASVLGFHMPRNFDFPYLRTNPALARRSWHTTMGQWFSDYIYRPLGAARGSDFRYGFNLLLTWTLVGLWHGAAWHFIVWGAANGLILAVYSVGLRRKKWSIPQFPGKKFCGWVVNITFLTITVSMFRAQTPGEALTMLGRVASGAGGFSIDPLWMLAALALFTVHVASYWYYKTDLLQRMGWIRRAMTVSAIVATIAFFGASGRAFVYFQF